MHRGHGRTTHRLWWSKNYCFSFLFNLIKWSIFNTYFWLIELKSFGRELIQLVFVNFKLISIALMIGEWLGSELVEYVGEDIFFDRFIWVIPDDSSLNLNYLFDI